MKINNKIKKIKQFSNNKERKKEKTRGASLSMSKKDKLSPPTSFSILVLGDDGFIVVVVVVVVVVNGNDGVVVVVENGGVVVFVIIGNDEVGVGEEGFEVVGNGSELSSEKVTKGFGVVIVVGGVFVPIVVFVLVLGLIIGSILNISRNETSSSLSRQIPFQKYSIKEKEKEREIKRTCWTVKGFGERNLRAEVDPAPKISFFFSLSFWVSGVGEIKSLFFSDFVL